MNVLRRVSLGLLALVLSACAARSAEPAPPAPTDTFGVTKGTPVYLQEFHIWWGFAYPDTQNAISHIESTYCSFREPWRLQWNCNGYPMVGLYDSRNLDIVRWQIRCIKAMGVTSVAVQVHPEIGKGLAFIQEKDGFLTKLLDIAAQEEFPLFFMDEVAFRPDAEAKDPKIMAQRVIRFLKQYGTHPGFYKIGGKPVYYYQTFGYWVGAEKTSEMMREVEAQVGGVHWMIFGDIGQVGTVPEVQSVVCGNNLDRQNRLTRKWEIDTPDTPYIYNLGRKFSKKIADIHYPKFDGTGQPWRQTMVAAYGHHGELLEKTVANSMRYKPDFLMLSSWNDYEEGTYIEPAWDVDGFAGDPYMYCKVVAKLRGVEFVPPPLPPKEALHPSIWEKLGYGDGAGPIIERIYRSHVRGGSLEVVVRDTASAVAGLEVVSQGDAWWAAPQGDETEASGTLKITSGSVAEAKEIVSPQGYQLGKACNTGNGKLRFALSSDVAALGDRPAVGVAYATDPSNPTRRVSITIPREKPALTMEPVGGTQNDLHLPMSPHFKAEEIGTDAWTGWQTGVAQTYAPAKLQGEEARIALDGQGCDLAIVSLLGPPREDRLVKSAAVPHDTQGRLVSYYVTLGSDQLDKAGVHFIWLRAKDSAGNWGSPRLYAVPNYQRPATTR